MTAFRIKGSAGPLANQSFALGEALYFSADGDGALRVGAQAGAAVLAELCLDAAGHPRLCRRLDSAGVQVNGKDWVDGRLQPGDEIRIGRHRFLLQAPGLRPGRVLAPDGAAPRRRLRVWLAVALLAAAGLAAWWWLLRATGP